MKKIILLLLLGFHQFIFAREEVSDLLQLNLKIGATNPLQSLRYLGVRNQSCQMVLGVCQKLETDLRNYIYDSQFNQLYAEIIRRSWPRLKPEEKRIISKLQKWAKNETEGFQLNAHAKGVPTFISGGTGTKIKKVIAKSVAVPLSRYKQRIKQWVDELDDSCSSSEDYVKKYATPKRKPQISKIVDGLYVGSVTLEEDIPDYMKLKNLTVYSVLEPFELYLPYKRVSPSLWHQLGVKQKLLRVPDHHVIPPKDMQNGVLDLEKTVERGNAVIQCQAGASRSASLAAAYVVKNHFPSVASSYQEDPERFQRDLKKVYLDYLPKGQKAIALPYPKKPIESWTREQKVLLTFLWMYQKRPVVHAHPDKIRSIVAWMKLYKPLPAIPISLETR